MLERLTKLLISLVYFGIVLVPRSVATGIKGTGARHVIALCYHGVRGDQRAEFAWQMDQVLRAGRAVALAAKMPVDGCRRVIAITFDDAFANLIENALPELENRRIPATPIKQRCLARWKKHPPTRSSFLKKLSLQS